MRRILALFALLATFAVQWLEVYQKQQMTKYFHSVYVDGRMGVNVDFDALEKAEPKVKPYEISMLLNAPAGALFLPVELAAWGRGPERLRDIDAFHNRVLWEFGLFGIPIWYAVGKFIDDTRATFTLYPDVEFRWYDWTVSLLCLASGFVVFSMGREEADFHAPVCYIYAGIGWMFLGTISLLFRIFQWRSLRRATAGNTPPIQA